MGLFDFFKKKENNSVATAVTLKSELFQSLSRYNEYIVRFIGMQQQGNYAPIAAYEKPSGEITGFLYIIGDDNSYALSAEEVIHRMETRFEKNLADGEINSYVILYHSRFANDDNHALALNDSELKAITVSYCFKTGIKGKAGLPYFFGEDEIKYQGFKDLSQEENNIIFRTRLQENKDYFQDREEITAPAFESEAGLTVKKSNTADISNTWCGIFGFETYRKPGGTQPLIEHYALARTQKPVLTKDNLAISQLEYEDVIIKALSLSAAPVSVFPVIKTAYTIDVVNKEINEWENVENSEAIISAVGHDTFGLSYFATDYAENRDLYLSKKEHTINISGIAFVLDVSTTNQPAGELQYSEDFTAYMPNNDLPNYGCFDFIGELEDFKETSLLEENSSKGYIMKVRLITNHDIKDFFTIDVFVTPENMRFKELKKGMKLTGMLQMQGQIAG